MKRLIIPFVASFGLALGLATGVVMVRTPKVAPVAAADSATARAGTSAPAITTRDSSAALRDSTAAQPHDSAGTVDTSRVAAASAEARTTAPTADQNSSGKGQSGTATKSLQVPVTAAPATAKVAKAPQRKAGPPAATPITDSLIGHRLAQVFAAMQPKDAARVLEQMNDNDVRAILGSLSSKQQAAILGSFPTARAALIVQTTLRTASTGGTE